MQIDDLPNAISAVDMVISSNPLIKAKIEHELPEISKADVAIRRSTQHSLERPATCAQWRTLPVDDPVRRTPDAVEDGAGFFEGHAAGAVVVFDEDGDEVDLDDLRALKPDVGVHALHRLA